MNRGKAILAAALAAALAVGALHAGEPPRPTLSIGEYATLEIGGEVRVDSTRRTADHADLALRGTNLRLTVDAHPNIRALIKLDLGNHVEIHGDRDEILEEALLVMSAVGGTGFGFFAGKGRAPYGQDVTLGMLQSYHHIADQDDSAEGRIFITDPPDERNNPGNGKRSLPPMRPGQLERVLQAGVKYEWEDKWKVELAAFRPNRYRYDTRLFDRDGGRNSSDAGVAARVWWMPFEDFVVQASAMVVRSGAMGNTGLREDAVPAARGTDFAKAVSAGFDWREGRWRVFGEYQHGWDWNFTKGYSTDTVQLGAAYAFAESWRVGGMAEGLRIRDAARGAETAYWKASLNLRHTFANGMYVLAEYGFERRRRTRVSVEDRARGHFAGFRLGFTF